MAVALEHDGKIASDSDLFNRIIVWVLDSRGEKLPWLVPVLGEKQTIMVDESSADKD